MSKYQNVVDFIRSLYNTEDDISLHEPVFLGNEKKYLEECVDSTYVSSVGKFVDLFEKMIADFTGAKRAVAVVNGTSALHASLRLLGVEPGDEVLTQSLTFVATCNAISMQFAVPVFIDVDKDTLGMSPSRLKDFLKENTKVINGNCINKGTGKKISACVPMHTFGHPARIEEIVEICNSYSIPVLEDAAEAIGSYSRGRHVGILGKIGILSFNGNKPVTTGGGGMIITSDAKLGERAKYITSTAKVPHKWEFYHDIAAYNYRMPNINAALGCAQLEKIQEILENKRQTANKYKQFFENRNDITFFTERERTRSNYWLNAILLKNKKERDIFLEESNNQGIGTRPAWNLMHKLPMYNKCQKAILENSEYISDRLVNIPSGVR